MWLVLSGAVQVESKGQALGKVKEKYTLRLFVCVHCTGRGKINLFIQSVLKEVSVTVFYGPRQYKWKSKLYLIVLRHNKAVLLIMVQTTLFISFLLDDNRIQKIPQLIMFTARK